MEKLRSFGLSSQITRSQEEEYWFPYHYVSQFKYDQFRQHFVDSWGINYVSTIEFLIRKTKNVSPLSVVDVGCGDGRMTRELAMTVPVERVVGVDCSKRAIALAKAMNHDVSNIEFFCLDITQNPSIGTYDLAILMEVFEHIPMDYANDFLQGVHRLLKKGGRLFLTVPHVNKPVEYKHYQHFSERSIKSYLEENFEVIEIVPFEKRGIRRKLMNFLLCNRCYILNNQLLLSVIYRWYKRNLFYCSSESQCQRIFVNAIAK